MSVSTPLACAACRTRGAVPPAPTATSTFLPRGTRTPGAGGASSPALSIRGLSTPLTALVAPPTLRVATSTAVTPTTRPLIRELYRRHARDGGELTDQRASLKVGACDSSCAQLCAHARREGVLVLDHICLVEGRHVRSRDALQRVESQQIRGQNQSAASTTLG